MFPLVTERHIISSLSPLSPSDVNLVAVKYDLLSPRGQCVHGHEIRKTIHKNLYTQVFLRQRKTS